MFTSLYLQSQSTGLTFFTPGESSEASRNNEHSLCEEILPQMKMDNTFETNRVQPGEEGWLYDKEQAFGPACMECSWDSDSSSIQEF
jgi:hypothetical protein